MQDAATTRAQAAQAGDIADISWRGALLLVVAATALYLAPYYWPPSFALSWLALWPAIELARARGPGRAAAWGYAWGLGIYVLGVYWLVHVTAAGWLALSAYLALYPSLFCCLVSWVERRWRAPIVLVAPVLWVALDFIRSHLFSGFPWLQLGHSQHACLPVIQIADAAGVYGVSFVLAMVAAAAAEVRAAAGATRRGASDRVRPAAAQAILAAAVVAGVVAYGHWRLASLCIEPGPKVAVVQGNIPQSLKLTYSHEESLAALAKHLRLSRESLAQRPDLIVWPETMSPGILNLPAAGFGQAGELAEQCRAELRKLAAESGAHLLIGSIAAMFEQAGGKSVARLFNSAFFFAPDGTLLGRYDKEHLVPFGEYVPLCSVFPFLRRLVPMATDLTPGSGQRPFEWRGHRFGVLICYEDVVASLARRQRQQGADFVVNITNDGWFKGSAELEQHNGISVFRAVENRLGVVRAANTGMSAFISPTGRVYAVLERDGDRREIEGWLAARVETCHARTLYTAIGEAWAWLCVAVAGTLVLAGFARRPARGPT